MNPTRTDPGSTGSRAAMWRARRLFQAAPLPVRAVRAVPMPAFVCATMLPYALLGATAIWGGPWHLIALAYLTVLIFTLDQLVAAATREDADGTAEFPAATTLLKALVLLHFISLGLVVWSVSPHAGLDTGETLGVVIAAGLLAGQIAHPAAHEMIHSRSWGMRGLGRMIYTSVLAGHHASAHLRLHHVHVGTSRDPNTPRPGEGFYHYARRASIDSFRGGFAEERRAQRGPLWRHVYGLYIAGGLALLAAAWTVSGWIGVLAFLAVALHAQVQILLSDYVQHYGLTRQMLPDGTPEPLGMQHSWNAPHVGSSALTLNATRHSHHHMAPRVSFPALDLRPDTMPILPYSLPVMATLALSPRHWRRVMDPLAAHWQHRDWHPRHQGRKPSGQAARALAQGRHVNVVPPRADPLPRRDGDDGLGSPRPRGNERGRV